MKNADKLAYFFDATDLDGVFRDWPREIGLVLCMDDDGGCEMLLHHRDEGREVIRKIAAVLGRPVGQFAVVPEVEGHPTRRVLFSDEQKLLAIVAAEKDLPEMAADHLINYRYELARRAKKQAAPAKPEPKVKREAEPQRWRPRFRLMDVGPRSKKAAQGMPGYHPAGPRDRECKFVEGELSLGRRGVRLVVAPELLTVRTAAFRVNDLAFRDDYSRFVVAREAIGDWEEGEALVLDMRMDLFPEGLLRRFEAGVRRAEVTVTDHGVFVAPGEVVEPAVAEPVAEPAPAAPAPRRRRRFLTPVRMVLVALTGIGLMTGSVMRAVDVSDLPQAAVFRLDK